MCLTNKVQASACNNEKLLATNNGVKRKKRKVARNLTSQHLTDRFNNTNKKGVAFFKMHNFGRQTRHLILEYGYRFHKAARFARLVHSNLCLVMALVDIKITDQLGTPSGRYDEHSSSFPLVRNQGFIVQ
jgi:hypothetical protein